MAKKDDELEEITEVEPTKEKAKPLNTMEGIPPVEPKKPEASGIDLSPLTAKIAELDSKLEKLITGEHKAKPAAQEKNLIEELGDW